MTITAWIMLLAAGVVLIRTICMASKMSVRDWRGHPLFFAAIAAANSLLAAGAVGIVLGWHKGTFLLLLGVALKLLTERRRSDA